MDRKTEGYATTPRFASNSPGRTLCAGQSSYNILNLLNFVLQINEEHVSPPASCGHSKESSAEPVLFSPDGSDGQFRLDDAERNCYYLRTSNPKEPQRTF